ncbi:MAG: ParA family protein [Candidatus Hermodarchaeota archaeon]
MKIIAFHSSKGGSGKTFLATNIGKAFALLGKKCVIMDCDISGPSFNTIFLSKTGSIYYSNDILLNRSSANKAICKTNIPNLDVIFADANPILGEGLLSFQESIHVHALRNLSNTGRQLSDLNYDILLIDTSPGFSPVSVNALLVAQTVIVVVRPDSYSLQTTNYILQTVYSKIKDSAIGSKKFFVVFNQIPHAAPEEIENILTLYEMELRKNLDINVLGHIYCMCRDVGTSLIQTPLLDEGSSGMDTILSITKQLLEN